MVHCEGACFVIGHATDMNVHLNMHPGIDRNCISRQDSQVDSHRRLKLPENTTSLESQKSTQTAFLLRFRLELATTCVHDRRHKTGPLRTRST